MKARGSLRQTLRLSIYGLLLGVAVADTAAAKSDQDSPPDGIRLWRNLYSGMSRSELKALYPDTDVLLSPDCAVEVLSNYRNKKLVSVILQSTDRNGACARFLTAELTQTYGAPANETAHGGGLMATWKAANLVWRSGQKIIRLAFVPGPGPAPAINLIYTVRTDGKIY